MPTHIHLEPDKLDADGNRLPPPVFSMPSCSMSKMTIRGYEFYREDFKYAVFHHTNLQHCKFIACDLSNAKFINCDLSFVSFSRVDLTNAELRECHITRTMFDTCLLKGTDFSTSHYGEIKDAFIKEIKSRFTLAGIEELRRMTLEGRIQTSSDWGYSSVVRALLERGSSRFILEPKQVSRTNKLDMLPFVPLLNSIGIGDTPDKNAIAKLLLDWTEEAISK